MSYRDYSEESVKEIMKKVSESQKKESTASKKSLGNSRNSNQKSGLDSGEIKERDYQYNHPTTAEVNRINETHIFIEKWFETSLSEETIWKEILTELENTFSIDGTSGKIRNYSSGKKWKYVNYSNHETVVRVSKMGSFANIKIFQRVGFWRSAIEGILHGSYTSLLLFGLIFAIFDSTLLQSIGIFALLWSLCGFTIYRYSVSSRDKKHKRMTNFMDKIVSRLPS